MKLFYGWVIVATGALVGCVGMGMLMSFGVFLLPIAEAQGWSRASIASDSTVAFLAMGVAALPWGVMFDRRGARIVVMCGGLIQGLGLMAASQTDSLFGFLATYGLSVGAGVGAFYVPLTAAAASWFTRNRSLAVSLVSAGLALGTTTVAPLARWLMAGHDWRYAMFSLGLISCAVIVPASLLLRRAPPAEPVSPAAASGMGALPADMTAAHALRTPVFWSLSLANFACCAAHSGPIFHMVSYAADCGIAPLTAATVLGAAGLAALSGRIVCGLLADRMGAKRTLVGCLFLQAFAISLYLIARDLNALYAVSMLFGFSYGGAMPLYAILVREYFPARIMGSVFGVVAMISTFGMALGPPVGGWLFDHFGSYGWLYVASASIRLAGALIGLTVRPPSCRPVAMAVA